MNEDIKAYLIVIGAFIVSIVSFLSDLLDKDIPFTAKHTIHLLKAGLGVVAFYGSDILLSHFLAKDEQDAPFVSILALNEGRTMEDFCNAIILNDKNYRTLAANALSEKRLLENTLASEIGI